MLFVLSCSCPCLPPDGKGRDALLLFVAPKLTTISFHLLTEVNSSVPKSCSLLPTYTPTIYYTVKQIGLQFSPSLKKKKLLMKNIREFDHKLKDVYHVKIASQLLKLMNLEVQFGVP